MRPEKSRKEIHKRTHVETKVKIDRCVEGIAFNTSQNIVVLINMINHGNTSNWQYYKRGLKEGKIIDTNFNILLRIDIHMIDLC